MRFVARQWTFDLQQRSYLMGIVNITPDSFSDGGLCCDPDAAIKHALQLIDDGADIIDLGAESSRPGALSVSSDEELSRILPVLEGILHECDFPVSIDTTKAEVARECLMRGASIINDISGFVRDDALPQVVKEFNAGCVLMHMRGVPETMQQCADYSDLMHEIVIELEQRIAIAREYNIAPESIMIDPGIGFAKKPIDNYTIINKLQCIVALGYPVLVGPSRKSFVAHVLEGCAPQERVWGTAAAVTASILHGAHFLRVHDVREMKDVMCVADAILRG